MLSLNSGDSIALGQVGNQTVEARWNDADFAQRIAVQEQIEFSRLAQELQTKITERGYLSYEPAPDCKCQPSN